MGSFFMQREKEQNSPSARKEFITREKELFFICKSEKVFHFLGFFLGAKREKREPFANEWPKETQSATQTTRNDERRKTQRKNRTQKAEKLHKKQSISSLSLSSFIFCETLKAYRERDIESRLASESNT